jgi:hypothetical protein
MDRKEENILAMSFDTAASGPTRAKAADILRVAGDGVTRKTTPSGRGLASQCLSGTVGDLAGCRQRGVRHRQPSGATTGSDDAYRLLDARIMAFWLYLHRAAARDDDDRLPFLI